MQIKVREARQAHDHLIVDVFTSEQDILEGTIQIAVIEGKVGQILVENAGHKWFSDSLIRREVRLKPGEPVLESQLNADLKWLNRNSYQSLGNFSEPFLEVSPSFKRGKDLGSTDVILKVEDRFPVRAFVGVDDSGIKVIGKDRFYAGLNWANVFGIDHRLTYES